MDLELRIAVELFIELATYLQEEPHPPMGDSCEEWLFLPTGVEYPFYVYRLG